MVTIKGVPRRQREYILIKHGQSYYYARTNVDDPDKYLIMANVGEKEGREIIKQANSQSTWGKDDGPIEADAIKPSDQ